MTTLREQHMEPGVVQQLGRIDLIAKVIVNGLRQGMHDSRRRGISSEFADFNPYVQGDDLRFIDWRLYARTDRLYVKSFQAETNMEVMVLLDVTESMAWRWEETISKLEYGVNLVAALSYLHIQQHDSVGLLLQDAERLHHLAPRARRTQLEAIYSTLHGVKPGKEESFPELVESLAGIRRHRGRLILCSDLEEDPERTSKALEHLAGHNDEIILLHLLDHAEVELPFEHATHLEDSETGELLEVDMKQLKKEHAEQLAAFRDFWRMRAAVWGICYVPIDTGMSYVDAIHDLIELLKVER